MKLTLRFETFTFHYKRPIPVGKKHVNHNQALVVFISANGSEEAVVHLTSLPKFHHYSVFEWKFVLEDFFSKEDLTFDQLDFTLPYFHATQAHVIKEGELLFAIESVLFAFIEKNFPKALPSTAEHSVKINGLYSKELGVNELPDCLKIKIRPGEEQCLETMSLMKDLLEKKPKMRFRLDGNRSFDLHPLLGLTHLLEEKNLLHSVEYIEEPFKNFSDVYQFKKVSALPLALDESVGPLIDQLDQFPHFYFVLKPSLLGLSKCFELTKRYFPRTIISSSFELASCFKSFLSIAAQNPEQHHGLDTSKYLPNEYSIETKTFLLPF